MAGKLTGSWAFLPHRQMFRLRRHLPLEEPLVTPLGIEPRASSVSRKRSATELWSQRLYSSASVARGTRAGVS